MTAFGTVAETPMAKEVTTKRRSLICCGMSSRQRSFPDAYLFVLDLAATPHATNTDIAEPPSGSLSPVTIPFVAKTLPGPSCAKICPGNHLKGTLRSNIAWPIRVETRNIVAWESAF